MADVEINANNFLGNEYSAFRAELYAFALSNPKEYFQLRSNVLLLVKNSGVNLVYKIVRGLLKDGELPNGNQILVWENINHRPSYPMQKINDISLSAAETYNEMIDEVVEILMPVDFNAIMNRTLAKVGEAQNLQLA